MNDRLPPGPEDGVLAQTLRMHRDPLEFLRGARERYGDVFTLRLATARPVIVVTAPDEVQPLLAADPATARAGEARRRVLPMASPCSIFGGDAERHRQARARVAALFEPAAVAERGQAMTAIAVRHADSWPRHRPVRVLPRMRALVDDVFVRVMLGVADERRARLLTSAIRRMLWTPGNPPLSIPGAADGLLGALAARAFQRRVAPLGRLLEDEIEARRRMTEPGDDVIARALAEAPRHPARALVDELIPLLMAAQEPAAASLAWLLDRLAHAPGLADRFAVAPDDAVIRETLRLRPPAIAALRRLTDARDVAGHRLPAGATVMLPIPVLQRDPRAYDEPDAFRPERWSADPPDRAFLPFGGGGRRCLGEHLARTYLTALAPAMLQRRRLRPLLGEPEKMVLRGTILVPKHSAPILAPCSADSGLKSASG
jgi:cytochrome P450 family 135